MSDAQYAATLIELRRLTLVGVVPPCFEAAHVDERPELVPSRQEVVAGLRERFGTKYAPPPTRAERVKKMNARRNVPPSGS